MNTNPLEKVIERKVCDYAKKKNIAVYKFTSPNRVSVPDRMFICENGNIFFIEFKRLGNKPTIKQAREIQRLAERNVSVFVIDNIDDGVKLIDGFLKINPC